MFREVSLEKNTHMERNIGSRDLNRFASSAQIDGLNA